MDHHEAPHDGGSARRTPLRAERGRAAVRPGNARVADAAKAAADGLRGVRRLDGSQTGGSARAPGVGVLFDPVVPVHSPRTRDVARAADRAGTADRAGAGDRAGTADRVGEPAADVGVWNPFRQQRRPDPRRSAARPEIGNLHTRLTATGVNVIATLVHGGRLCHGTAVGSSSSQGRVRAVAEATVAALQIVADEPLPVGVDRIRWVGGSPARMEVVLIWTIGSGEEVSTGTAPADDGPDGADGAVMQATLDALGGRLEQLVRGTSPR